ncbi:MAG: flagellar export protein FliJ [Acidobacteriota bacterium]|jgi:flagellar FliJ protein|nr:flagellar export protein FliJ [Acidobacteriota bacterium]
MGRFRFNLQTLLQHREDQEQTARDELLRRSFRVQSEMRRLDELRAKAKATAEEMVARQAENLPHGELDGYRLYLDRLRAETGVCEENLARLRMEVEEQKKAVVEASKRRKTISSLREKKEKAFTLEQEKAWQKEMDDLVVVRYKGRA